MLELLKLRINGEEVGEQDVLSLRKTNTAISRNLDPVGPSLENSLITYVNNPSASLIIISEASKTTSSPCSNLQ